MSAELERRVKTLEQEMKILKNQIQTTLRDIQEQVLVHYYPSLRASEAPVLGGKKNGSGAASNPVSEEIEPASTLPKVRQVTLDDIRNGAVQVTPPPNAPDELLSTANEANEASLSELAHWVGDSAIEIGIKRTKKLIEMRAKSGAMSPEVQDILMQLISLCEDDEDAGSETIKETIAIFLKLNQL